MHTIPDEQQAIVFYHQKLMEERIAQGNQKIESRLSHMDSAIGKMAKDIRCLMKTKSQSRNGRVKSFDVFPITSMDALDALMSRMEEEEDLHLFVVIRLYPQFSASIVSILWFILQKNTITKGGDNKANLLKKTLSDDLANKFNATGRFGKMKAMDHGFFQLLFGTKHYLFIRLLDYNIYANIFISDTECWEEENFNERDFAAFIKKCGHNRSSRYFKKSLQRVVSTTIKTVDEDDYK